MYNLELLYKLIEMNTTHRLCVTLYVDVLLQTSGRSALFYGAQENDLEIIKLLIQGGANLSLKDKVSTYSPV